MPSFSWLSLTLTYPHALAMAVALAAIVLVLFRSATGRSPEVPLPWEGLFIEAPPRRVRRVPPPSIWVLALATLALGVASGIPVGAPPQGRPRLHVILLEADVASQSREVGGRRRLDHSVDALRAWSSARPAIDRFLLIRVGAEPRVVGAGLSAAQLREAMERIVAGDAAADWPVAFRLALSHLRGSDRDLVVAAGEPRRRLADWSLRAGIVAPPAVFLRSGAGAPNTAVETVRVHRSPFRAEDHETDVLIRFRHFGAAPGRRATVEVNGKPMVEREVPAGQDQLVVWSLSRVIRESGVLTVRLSPPDGQPADDVARAVLPEGRPLRVGVSGVGPHARRVLERLAQAFRVELLDPAAGAPDAGGPPDLAVVASPGVPGASLPECNALVFGGSGPPVRATPLGPDPEHPLCRDVTRVDVAEVPAWPPAEEEQPTDVALHGALEDGPGGAGRICPLVWTTSRERLRRAHFAFDPFAPGPRYQGFRAAAMLLINAIEWLTSENALPLASPAGTPVPLEGIGPGAVALLREAEGRDPEEVLAVSSEALELPGPASELAGIYQLRRGGRPAGRFAVNAVAGPIEREAGPDLEAPGQATTAGTPSGAPAPADSRWWYLFLALLGLESLLVVLESGLLGKARRRRREAKVQAGAAASARRARAES